MLVRAWGLRWLGREGWWEGKRRGGQEERTLATPGEWDTGRRTGSWGQGDKNIVHRTEFGVLGKLAYNLGRGNGMFWGV